MHSRAWILNLIMCQPALVLIIRYWYSTRWTIGSDSLHQLGFLFCGYLAEISVTRACSRWITYSLLQAVNGGGDRLAEKSFILNKVAQLFTYTCMVDYPRRWSSFFDNLVESVSLGPAAVDLYLRIMLAIDGEVVDRDIAHTDQVGPVCPLFVCCLKVVAWCSG